MKSKSYEDKTKQAIPSPIKILKSLTTIHGLNHLAETSGWRLLGWGFIMISNLLFTVYLIMVIKIRYESSQVLTRLDATCRVSQVPFPAVSICTTNVISMNQTRNIHRILKFYQRNEGEIESFFESLQQLTHFGFGSAHVEHFPEIMKILKYQYFTIESIMEELHPPCDSLLLYCEFNQKMKRCREVFKMIKTLDGFCCTFNYAALNDATEESLWEDDPDLEYYDDRKIGSIITTSKSGRGSGMTALVKIDPADYPPWSNAIVYGAKIIISDPNDFPETTVTFRHVTVGEAIDIKIEPLVFLSEDSVRRVPVDVRGCWFHDEALLGHTDRYSFETCTTECTMRAYNNQCQCIPYRYPRENGSRVCELADVSCLHNMTVLGMAPCPCYIECADKKYIVRSNLMPFSTKDFAPNLTNNQNLETLVCIKVFFGESTCDCYKKTLVMDFDRLVGSYGGLISLSIGGSILTIFEVLYLTISYILAVVWRKISHITRKKKLAKK